MVKTVKEKENKNNYTAVRMLAGPLTNLLTCHQRPTGPHRRRIHGLG